MAGLGALGDDDVGDGFIRIVFWLAVFSSYLSYPDRKGEKRTRLFSFAAGLLHAGCHFVD